LVLGILTIEFISLRLLMLPFLGFTVGCRGMVVAEEWADGEKGEVNLSLSRFLTL